MNKKFLYWLPRILGILFAIFISIFALDAFGEGIPFLEAIVGFFNPSHSNIYRDCHFTHRLEMGDGRRNLVYPCRCFLYGLDAQPALVCIPDHWRTTRPDRHPLHRRTFYIQKSPE